MSTLLHRLVSLGIWLWLAVAAVIFALIMVYAELQSPDSLMWTGRALPGVDRGGIVAYSYNGISFHQVLDGVSDAPGPTRVTVEVNPSNPYEVVADRMSARLLEAGLVVGPLVLAALLLAIGAARLRRGRRLESVVGYGQGLPSDHLERLLERQREGRDP